MSRANVSHSATAKFLDSPIYWLLLSLVVVTALYFSVQDLLTYAGIDLRNRVVGARALLASLDPYSTDWRPGMPLELADPQQRYPGLSRVTAVPPVLFAYMPFAPLAYRSQQIIWWFLQWISISATILVLYKSFAEKAERRLFLLVVVLCVVGSWFWRLHVERGQYYIFPTMLFCFDAAALRWSRSRPAWLGIPSGIAIALRPTNVILVPLFWFMNERRAAVVAAGVGALILLTSLFVVGWPVWKHYFQTVSDYAYVEIDPTFEEQHFGPVAAVAPDVVEGMDLKKSLPHKSGGSTIGALFETPWAIPLSRVVAVLLFVLGSAAMWWMRRQQRMPRDALLLFLSIMLVFIDFARPMRITYADVAFLPVIAFLLPLIPRRGLLLAIAIVSFVCYLGPLESKWVVHLRHLFSVTLVSAVLGYTVWKLRPVGLLAARRGADAG